MPGCPCHCVLQGSFSRAQDNPPLPLCCLLFEEGLVKTRGNHTNSPFLSSGDAQDCVTPVGLSEKPFLIANCSAASLFAWLFPPAPFRFWKLGIQSSGIPEIKALVLPGSRQARNSPRAAVPGRLHLKLEPCLPFICTKQLQTPGLPSEL